MNPHDSRAVDAEEVCQLIAQCVLDVRDNAHIDVLRVLVSAYNLAWMKAHGSYIAGDAGDYELAVQRDDFGRPLLTRVDHSFPSWLDGAEVTLIRAVASGDRRRAG